MLTLGVLLLALAGCKQSEAEKLYQECKQLRASKERDQALKKCDAAVEAEGPKWAKQEAAKAALEMRAEQLEEVGKQMEKTLEKFK